MTRDEFIDKIGIANRTLDNLNSMLNKIEEDKKEAISQFIETNKEFNYDDRVRVYKQENEDFLGYGYVKGFFVDEDYGVIIYDILKEDPKNKSCSDHPFEESRFGSSFNDKQYCEILLKKV